MAGRGPGATLGDALQGAGSVTEAAEVVVDHLVQHGLDLPSLYLDQGGRLRCIAQHGYWQVLDGIPYGVGVIGRTFQTGRATEVADATSDEGFLFAAPDLRSQVSVPVRWSGRVVGTLSVESTGALPPGTRPLLEDAAVAFERRLDELDGPPPESLAQRIARLVTAMTELEREEEVRRAALEAATEIAGTSTAAIVEPCGAGAVAVVAGRGPLHAALSSAHPDDLAQLDRWVVQGASSVTGGTAASELVTHGRLRERGIAALAVVPMTASGSHLGSLVVASPTPHTFSEVAMPALELLGAQAAASIRIARTVAALRRRVRQDPLTELGHHATFQEELRTWLADPPGDRHVAVLLIDVDDFKRINDRDGHQQGDRVLRELSVTLAGALRDGDRLYRIGGDEFACLVAVRRPEDATDIAERMAAAARGGRTTVSVGVAIADGHEDPDALVARADAAMYAAKAAGRDTVGIAPRPAGIGG